MSDSQGVVDPLTRAIVSNAFVNFANEGVDILDKTAVSPVLSEGADRCLAITDASARMLGLSATGLPVHAAACELVVEKTLEKFGTDFQPGDMILQNDPWLGGGNHLPDWTFVKPIFIDDKLAFFAMIRGHQADTKGHMPGGYAPGAFDIQAEGLLIPPTKIATSDGTTEVYDFIMRNVRWPDSVRIDNLAMMGALKKVDDKLQELCAKYSLGIVQGAMDIVIRDSESAVRNEIAKWPDGTYTGESQVDGDGSGNETPKVRVAITIEGDQLTFDFTESDDQVTFINCPYTTTYTLTAIGLLPRFDPDIPLNHGKLAPLNLITRKGSIVDPEYPATVGACAVFAGGTIVEAIIAALGKAIPHKLEAHCSPAMQWICFGDDPRTGEPYLGANFQQDGGTGATPNVDGIHGAGIACGGGLIQAYPVEIVELLFPWRTLKWELVTDSAGAGKHRGGLGTTWQALNYGGDAVFSTGGSSGETHAPIGLDGGKDGIYAKIWAIRDGEEIKVSTMSNFQHKDGDIVGTLASGGGGHGNPFERDVEMVLNDVRDGFVSVEGAREDYGVVIDPETLGLDVTETEKLRTL